jgi:hypothetical protein
MKAKHSVHQTQWAAQFAVASELCKRGYQVALTLGNHPAVDLMVSSPEGHQFSVDVKGLYKPNFWLVQSKQARRDLFYVFAYVPKTQPNQFFVMTPRQVNEAIDENWKKYCIKHQLAGAEADAIKNRMGGVEWKIAATHTDWDILPK